MGLTQLDSCRLVDKVQQAAGGGRAPGSGQQLEEELGLVGDTV